MYYVDTKGPIGCFTEKEYGNYFEYSDMCEENGGYTYYEGADNAWNYPHMVWVGGVHGAKWRQAIVKKTVAYVVVDEDDNCMPVVEKWKLKKNDVYIA